jgi:hypothetical protein
MQIDTKFWNWRMQVVTAFKSTAAFSIAEFGNLDENDRHWLEHQAAKWKYEQSHRLDKPITTFAPGRPPARAATQPDFLPAPAPSPGNRVQA